MRPDGPVLATEDTEDTEDAEDAEDAGELYMAAPDAVGMAGDTPCSSTDARCCPQQALIGQAARVNRLVCLAAPRLVFPGDSRS